MRWRRWLIATGLAALLPLLWLVFVAKYDTNLFVHYQKVDERTLLVEVGGPPRGWTWLAHVTENSSEVRIEVDSMDWLPGPGTAYAVRVQFTVRLTQPLGDRVVKDGAGRLAVLTKCLDNVCSPAPSP